MTKAAILQSNYLPWPGYFDLISSVDKLVLYDTAQYTKNDWRNRNRIKTEKGLRWLTVPVRTAGRLGQAINEVELDGQDWPRSHLSQLEQAYSGAPFYECTMEAIKPVLLSGHAYLSELNEALIRIFCQKLDIRTPLVRSEALPHKGTATEKIAQLCQGVSATTYVSGPAAQCYLDVDFLARSGIAVEWFDYPPTIPYTQQWGEFEPGVSTIDLLFNCGAGAGDYVKR